MDCGSCGNSASSSSPAGTQKLLGASEFAVACATLQASVLQLCIQGEPRCPEASLIVTRSVQCLVSSSGAAAAALGRLNAAGLFQQAFPTTRMAALCFALKRAATVASLGGGSPLVAAAQRQFDRMADDVLAALRHLAPLLASQLARDGETAWGWAWSLRAPVHACVTAQSDRSMPTLL